jgi:hypothetical protein
MAQMKLNNIFFAFNLISSIIPKNHLRTEVVYEN